jgi:hypothetical protein
VSIFRRRKQAAEPLPPVLTRLGGKSRYTGAKIIKNVAVLDWSTTHGGVGLVYSLRGGSHDPNRLIDDLHDEYRPELSYHFASIVVPQWHWDLWGPDLKAVDLYKGGAESDVYSPTWQQLADVLGTAVPLWYDRLRDPESILAWYPGAPAAEVPAFDDEFRTEPFLALAADEPDGSPVIELCLWLARTYRDDLTEDSWRFINQLRQLPEEVPRGWTLAAIPMELRRPEAEKPSLRTRREAWWQILNRRDTLAAKVASLGEMWDGGRDWPAGGLARVCPNECPTAAIWAARLDPTPNKSPTVLEQRLLRSIDLQERRGGLMQDSSTGLPAIFCENSREGKHVATLDPRWLQTISPLASVTLSRSTVWITTEDGGLWLAPESPGAGLNWGYRGTGPYTLAILLNLLLDDITSPAVEGFPTPPIGLLRLIRHAGSQVIYTREQLEDARKEPMPAGNEPWDVEDPVGPGAIEPAEDEE